MRVIFLLQTDFEDSSMKVFAKFDVLTLTLQCIHSFSHVSLEYQIQTNYYPIFKINKKA